MRIVNLMIDSFLIYIIATTIPIFLFVNLSEPTMQQTFIVGLLQILLGALYYMLFESLWQRTPGKFVTRTKVMMLDGSKPSFTTVLLRTVIRWVPFEALSFVGHAYPMGWHDRWSQTAVVPANYTPVDVQALTTAGHKTSRLLIFLIVSLILLIPIVGILSSIVLSSLNVAREKGRDARRIADVKQIQLGAELYFDDHSEAYPQSLDELAPNYLPALPVDPLTGASYLYANCSPTSYHVGTSLEDATAKALLEDNDLGPMCDADPINGADEAACFDGAIGAACFDVTSYYDQNEVATDEEPEAALPQASAKDLECEANYSTNVDKVVAMYEQDSGTLAKALFYSERLAICVGIVEQTKKNVVNVDVLNAATIVQLDAEDTAIAYEDYAK